MTTTEEQEEDQPYLLLPNELQSKILRNVRDLNTAYALELVSKSFRTVTLREVWMNIGRLEVILLKNRRFTLNGKGFPDWMRCEMRIFHLLSKILLFSHRKLSHVTINVRDLTENNSQLFTGILENILNKRLPKLDTLNLSLNLFWTVPNNLALTLIQVFTAQLKTLHLDSGVRESSSVDKTRKIRQICEAVSECRQLEQLDVGCLFWMNCSNVSCSDLLGFKPALLGLELGFGYDFGDVFPHGLADALIQSDIQCLRTFTINSPKRQFLQDHTRRFVTEFIELYHAKCDIIIPDGDVMDRTRHLLPSHEPCHHPLESVQRLQISTLAVIESPRLLLEICPNVRQIEIVDVNGGLDLNKDLVPLILDCLNFIQDRRSCQDNAHFFPTMTIQIQNFEYPKPYFACAADQSQLLRSLKSLLKAAAHKTPKANSASIGGLESVHDKWDQFYALKIRVAHDDLFVADENVGGDDDFGSYCESQVLLIDFYPDIIKKKNRKRLNDGQNY